MDIALSASQYVMLGVLGIEVKLDTSLFAVSLLSEPFRSCKIFMKGMLIEECSNCTEVSREIILFLDRCPC